MERKKIIGLANAAGLALMLLRRMSRGRTSIDFRGRVAVITGGSRGLGLALARELAAEGARLALLAREADELDRARDDLAARGAEVLALTCDVRNQADVQRAIAQVVAHFGRLDVLINNAGVIQVGPLEHMQLDDFEDAFAVHLWGPLYAMLAAIPHMRRQRGGRIVNIASIGGLVAVPHLTPYSASKFALVGLSDGVRAELAKDDIEVTTVCPGLMRTGSHLNAFFKGQQRREFTLFTLLGALPISSIDAQRAARQIVDACRRADPHLTISVQARLLALANHLLPDVTARAMALVARVLPGTDGAQGNPRRSGWESRTSLAPSVLTRLADRATEEYNGLREHTPLTH
jgi:NAD(P)-dependent dehydrogenase (short-subunit alcohol dehydrogenase family)